MKTKELWDEISIGEGIDLIVIEGQEDYVDNSDYKEFYEITLGIESSGDCLNLVSMTREDFLFSRNNFKIEQLADNMSEKTLIKSITSNIEIVEEAVNEFLDEYESQGF